MNKKNLPVTNVPTFPKQDSLTRFKNFKGTPSDIREFTVLETMSQYDFNVTFNVVLKMVNGQIKT